MEIDDLKNDWAEVTNQSNRKNILTSENINEMTKKKYQSKVNKIKYSELIGSIICFLGLIYIGINFSKLDTIFLQATGVVTILLLIIIPSLSYVSINRLNTKENFNKPYIETIKEFTNQKLEFVKYQKINGFLVYLLLVTTIILLPKFFSGKDVTLNKWFWGFAFSLGYIFLLLFSKWVEKKYGNILKQTEEVLKEIEP